MTMSASHLTLVVEPGTHRTGPTAATGDLLVDLVSCRPVHLTHADTDLIDWVNNRPTVLGPDVDPRDANPAQLNLDWFAEYVGKYGKTDGARAVHLAGALTRYVLPYLVEWALDREPGSSTVGNFAFGRGTYLAEVLAGQQPLPAATVAGDLLDRRAAACVWLTLPDAGAVSRGGLAAVQDKVSARELTTSRDGSNRVLVRAAELRRLGLLIEPQGSHGVAKGTADNYLSPLKQAMLRAHDHGADVRGDYRRLFSIEPLLDDRLREPREDAGYFDLHTVRAIAAHLSVVHQIVLWMLRLTGMRIGEAYGLLVADFVQRADGAWSLVINKQGGSSVVVRSKRDGTFHRKDEKPGTKNGEPRTIRVPTVLAELLVLVVKIFHTDPDGTVRTESRLIPGLRGDDRAGAAGFRSMLVGAVAAARVDRPIPHDFRGNLITDLENAGVQRRLAEYYTGHRENKQTVHESYDDGVPVELQAPVTDAVAALASAAGFDQLIVPTARVESWGVGTTMWRRRDQIRAAMSTLGWVLQPEGFDADANLLRTEEVADRIGRSPVEVRRLYTSGKIPARRCVISGVRTWLADATDVEAYLNRGSQVALGELAEQIGMTYHRTLALCTRLGVLGSDRRTGTAIRLGADAVAAVHAELDRRQTEADSVMDLGEAAKHLQLPINQIEKLLRSCDLVARPDPRGTRRRYVTRDSVEQYSARADAVSADGETKFVPSQVARTVLGVTRNQLSALVGMRRLASAGINRREHIGLASALDYAARLGLPTSVQEALISAAVER